MEGWNGDSSPALSTQFDSEVMIFLERLSPTSGLRRVADPNVVLAFQANGIVLPQTRSGKKAPLLGPLRDAAMSTRRDTWPLSTKTCNQVQLVPQSALP